MVVQLGDDGRILGAAPDRAHAQLRIEQQARRGVEHGLAFLRLRLVVLKIRFVVTGKRRDVAPEHWHALGADHVIRRGRALQRKLCNVSALREVEMLRFCMLRHHHWRANSSRQITAQGSLCHTQATR